MTCETCVQCKFLKCQIATIYGLEMFMCKKSKAKQWLMKLTVEIGLVERFEKRDTDLQI